MSTYLKKLSVRGVRSFGPDEDQEIVFKRPLTVISGMNGCGKTTIIECLKFVCSGSLPPNSNNGQGFVHDPKLCNQSVVKGQVCLTFAARGKRMVQVQRNVQVSQARTRMSFKQLEGSVNVKEPGKDIQRVSGKCTAMDKTVPEFLGVSKAVMENVLFCHQEDSCWPLLESTVLKKKFDDIFQSSRYSKALKELKDQKKELVSQMKEYTANHRVFEVHKRNADKLEVEVDQLQEKEAEVKRTADKLSKEEEELVEQINDYQMKLAEVEEEKRALDTLRIQYKERKKNIARMAKEIEKSGIDPEDLRQKSVDDLNSGSQRNEFEQGVAEHAEQEKVVADISARMRENEEKIQSLNVACSGLDTKLDALLKAESSLMSHVVNFTRQYQPDSDHLKNFEDVQASVANAVQMEAKFRRELDEERSEQALACYSQAKMMMETEKQSCASALQSAKRDINKEVQRLQDELSASMSERDVVTDKLKTANSTVDKLSEKISKLDQELREVGQSGAELKRLTQLVKSSLEEKEKLESSQSSGELNEKLNEIEEQQREIESERKSIEAKLAECESQQENFFKFNKCVDGIVSAVDNLDVTPIEDHLRGVDASLEPAATSTLETSKVLLNDLRALSDNVKSIEQLMEDVDNKYNPKLEYLQNKLEELLELHKGKLESIDEELRTIANKRAEYKASMRDDVVDQLRKKSQEAPPPLPDAAAGRSFDTDVDFEEVSKILEENRIKAEKECSKNDLSTNQINRRLAHLHDEDSCPTCYQRIPPNYPACDSVDEKDQRKYWKRAEDVVNRQGKVVRDIPEFTVKSKKGKELGRVGPFKKGTRLIGKDHLLAHLVLQLTEAEDKVLVAERKLKRDKATEEVTAFAINSVKIKAIKRARSELAALEKDRAMINRKMSQLEDESNEKNQRKRVLEGVVAEVEKALNQIEKYRTPLERLKNELDLAKTAASKLDGVVLSDERHLLNPGQSVPNPIDEVREEERKLKQQSMQVTRSRESLLNERSEQQQKLNALESKLNKLQQQKLALSEKTSSVNDFNRQRAELSQEKEAKMKEIKSLRSQERSAATAHANAKRALDTKRLSGADHISSLEKKVAAVHHAIIDLENIRSNMDSVPKDIQAQLRSSAEKFTNLRTEVKADRQLRKKEREELDRLGKVKAERQSALDNISRSVDFIKECQTVQELGQKLQDLRKTVNKGGDVDAMEDEKDKAEERLATIKENLNKNEGRLETMHSRIKEIKRELKGNTQYVNIDVKCRVENIKKNVTDLAAKDLDKYHSALDTALMQFHQLKIDQINTRLAELWPIMYKGGDVDKIELRSEKATGTVRKNYNYRVVMTKGDTELDMRGRCSAGQKMLASLAIRMALADSFSQNCGVLCLDEPTTNLDKKNKIGLAYGLVQLLKYHEASRNYQLVVITHDASFVDYLSNEIRNVEFSGQANYYTVRRRSSPQSGGWTSEIIPTNFEHSSG